MVQHLEQECGMVEETCKLYCGLKMRRNELKIHMTDSCIYRNLRCGHCKEGFEYCDMISHLDQCPKLVVSCELNCGRTLPRENMTQHLEQECGLVMMKCKLRCGMKLTRGELKIHVTDTCMYRKIRCEHCAEYFKFCDISNHLEVCPKMIVSCELECGVVMCRENMAQHLEQVCGLVEEMCELGCGMKLTRDELKIHLADACVQRKIRCMHCYNYLRVCDISTHINECPKMKLLCELKCGKIMCREDVSLHLEEYCSEK